MAQIICFKTRNTLANFKKPEFVPLSDDFLNGNSVLTKEDEKLIHKSIHASDKVLENTDEFYEFDAFDYHMEYIHRCYLRMERSDETKKQPKFLVVSPENYNEIKKMKKLRVNLPKRKKKKSKMKKVAKKIKKSS